MRCFQRRTPRYQSRPHSHAMIALHGDTRIDNYWLRDDAPQPKSWNYLQQENSYGHRVMALHKPCDRILKEIIDHSATRGFAPYIKMATIRRTSCEYAIYQRQSAFSEEWDEWENIARCQQARLIVSFYSIS